MNKDKRLAKMEEAIKAAILVLEMESKVDIIPMLKAAIAKEK